MKHQSIADHNPYLRDPVSREKQLRKNVISSSAVEGIHLSESIFDDQALAAKITALKELNNTKH